MIKLALHDYPKFLAYANPILVQDSTLRIYTDQYEGVYAYHIILQRCGYKSAKLGTLTEGFSLSEEDYVWFVLKWS